MTQMTNIMLTNNDLKKYIDIVFHYAKTIEYVVLYQGEAHPSIGKYIQEQQIEPKKVKKWQGTKAYGKSNMLYRFEATFSFKKILLKFDNFFVIEKREIGPNTYACQIEDTDWGQSDIAFFDKDGDCISYITAHEGEILVNDTYIKHFEPFIIDHRSSYIFGL